MTRRQAPLAVISCFLAAVFVAIALLPVPVVQASAPFPDVSVSHP